MKEKSIVFFFKFRELSMISGFSCHDYFENICLLSYYGCVAAINSEVLSENFGFTVYLTKRYSRSNKQGSWRFPWEKSNENLLGSLTVNFLLDCGRW